MASNIAAPALYQSRPLLDFFISFDLRPSDRAFEREEADLVVPGRGVKSVEQLEQNAAAADIELSGDDLERLDTVSSDFYPISRMRNAGELVRRLVSR